MATYWEKLKDPRWQKKRLEILNRDDWTCKLCGETSETLHVHHGFYDRGCDPWEYQNNTLHTLCEHCHEVVQDRLRDIHFEIAMIRASSLDAVLWLLGTLREIRESENLNPGMESIESSLWYVGLIAGDVIPWERLTRPVPLVEPTDEIEEDIALGMGCSA